MIGVYANCFTGFRIAVDQPDSSNRKRKLWEHQSPPSNRKRLL